MWSPCFVFCVVQEDSQAAILGENSFSALYQNPSESEDSPLELSMSESDPTTAVTPSAPKPAPSKKRPHKSKMKSAFFFLCLVFSALNFV